MKNKTYIIILLLISGLLVFFFFYSKRTHVEKIPDTLLIQYEKEQEYINDLNKNNYTFDNPKVILNPYGNSPLTALIMFKTDIEEDVEITVEGKDEKTTITNSFEKNKIQIIPVYGLYADYNNKVKLKMGDKEKIITIKTEPLPEDFIKPTNMFVDKNLVDNDLIFVSVSLDGYTSAYDINGDPRWYLIGNYAWNINRLKNGRLMLSSPRSIAPPYYTIGLVEMDLTGKIYKEYVLPGGYHHDYYEMENGDLLVASNKFENNTVEDYIVLIDRKTGEIKKEWDLTQILPREDGKSAMWDETDWFHNNSVWYNKNTNSIILSGRHQDAVISVDFDSGDLNWIIGDPTNWSKDMQKYFFKPISDNFEWQWAQHAAMVLPNNDIFIFDNGNNRSKIEEEYIDASNNYSRGVIYRINTSDMTIEQVWQYGKERGSEFYSPYISDVDYIENNHYLIHSGGIVSKNGEAMNDPAPMVEGATAKSITVELLNDKKILELELPTNYFHAEKMSLYSNNKFEFGKGIRLGNLNETESINEKNNLLFASTNIPEEYEIEFKKEVDRLVFKGKLLEGTKVEIILDNFFDRKTYLFTASNKTYTAMCIYIFNEEKNSNLEEINVNSYINDTGIKGKYNIYLKINDKIYDTKKFVIFD